MTWSHNLEILISNHNLSAKLCIYFVCNNVCALFVTFLLSLFVHFDFQVVTSSHEFSTKLCVYFVSITCVHYLLPFYHCLYAFCILPNGCVYFVFISHITHKVHARFCTELFGNHDFQVTDSMQNRVFVCTSAGTLVIITLLLILFRNLSAFYPIRFEL